MIEIGPTRTTQPQNNNNNNNCKLPSQNKDDEEPLSKYKISLINIIKFMAI